ncbi:MAG TPA: LmeA family phospholipid-binding protein [Solirubrobacteraceae bacterium]|nr:LmeA family phospholipid-binding protein [Solirubrobacteraceae bacterium]
MALNKSKVLGIAAALAVAVAVALGLAQVFLPGIAAQRIRDSVGRFGIVKSVNVQAWPAVELLWGQADSVTVRAASLDMNAEQSAQMLEEARGVSEMHFTADSSHEGPLQLRDVSLNKRGNVLRVEARLSQSDAQAALPPGFDMRLVGSEGGEVKVLASGRLFGVGASIEAVARAEDGKLVVRPTGFPLDAVGLTLFSNPHIRVDGVGVRAGIGPEGSSSYWLTMTGSLH